MNRVTPTERLSVIEYDDPDNRILECAAAAKSDYIVTADKDLLRLKQFGGSPIVRAGVLDRDVETARDINLSPIRHARRQIT